MNLTKYASTLVTLTFVASCASTQLSENKMTQTQPEPPRAEKRPQTHEIHSDVRVDEYGWLRDREDPETIAYLEAENAYTEARMAHTEDAQETLYDEMLSRIKETDISAPYKNGDYFYYTRTEEGKNYEIHCRKEGSLDAEEVIIFDENVEADGHDYFSLGAFEVSPDGRLLAYSVDVTGNERYTLKIRDLKTGVDRDEVVTDTYYAVEWSNDGEYLFYNRVDDTNRPWQVWRHALGSDAQADEKVYEDADDAYFVSVSKTRSKGYLMVYSRSAVTTEFRVLSADDPTGNFKVIEPRRPAVEYYVDHHDDRFLILTNDDATNFRLMVAPVDNPGRASWSELIAESDSKTLTGVSAFQDFMVVQEREFGLPRLRVHTWDSGETHYVEFPEPTYAASPVYNFTYDTDRIRYSYTSLVTPRSVYDWNVETREASLIKETEVLDYDREDYVSERITAVSHDGVEVPISLVYKRGVRTEAAPLWLAGYGSYGASYDPHFSTTRIAILDRGVIFAIAHIRGGGELGRQWKEDGKFLNKKNTFKDFIASAEHLIEAGYTSSEKLAIQGRSAGGLLMGAVVNMRPDLFAVVVAGVPFVDVINTMLDETIPLTVIEWEEWGNPNDPVYYEYIKSYSPYDNVAEMDYPDMLITAGLNDPRVAYWEPAKWTARLRDRKTDDNLLLLKTNMGAGHGGASGRYDFLKEIAFEYAFVLDRLDLLNGE